MRLTVFPTVFPAELALGLAELHVERSYPFGRTVDWWGALVLCTDLARLFSFIREPCPEPAPTLTVDEERTAEWRRRFAELPAEHQALVEAVADSDEYGPAEQLLLWGGP